MRTFFAPARSILSRPEVCSHKKVTGVTIKPNKLLSKFGSHSESQILKAADFRWVNCSETACFYPPICYTYIRLKLKNSVNHPTVTSSNIFAQSCGKCSLPRLDVTHSGSARCTSAFGLHKNFPPTHREYL